MDLASAFAAGSMNAVASNMTYGFIDLKRPSEMFPGDDEMQMMFLMGQLAGNIGSLDVAAGEAGTGAGMISWGTAEAGSTIELAPSGIGAVVPLTGAGAAAVGCALTAHSALVVAKASENTAIIINEMHELHDHMTENGHSGSDEPAPEQGLSDSNPNAVNSNTEIVNGENGTQVNSKTLWKGHGKERIDVENPNPKQRPGQIHYQDNQGNKYIYDRASGKFKNAPKKVNEMLNDPKFKKAVEKGLKYLGT